MEILAQSPGATPLPIAAGVVAMIRAAAVAARPHEACGLLFRDSGGAIVAASIARNVSRTPRRRFEIDPAHLFAAQRGARGSGLMLGGCWHSHPDGDPLPSRHDAQGAKGLGGVWLIEANGAIRAFRAEPSGLQPLGLAEMDLAVVAPPLAPR